MTWVRRKVNVYKLEEIPFDDQKIKIMDVSKLSVILDGYKLPFEFGSWCYTQRRCKNHLHHIEGLSRYETAENSLRKKRKDTVKKYLEYLLIHIRLGKSKYSLKTGLAQFQQFVNWCDRHYESGLDCKKEFVRAVEIYTQNLIDEVRRNNKNINTAAALQFVVMHAGKGIYGDPYGDLFRYIKKISRSSAATVVTEKPENEDAKKTLKVYQDVFNQLYEFVTKCEPFPKKITLKHSFFWFFPTSLPFAGPSNIHKKPALKNKFTAYDYENGKIRNFSEIQAQYKNNSEDQIRSAIKKAQKSLLQANKNCCHKRRVNSAVLAFQVFVMMFSANTGMNLSQISSLPKLSKYTTSKSKQGFKQIKYRAGGKDVEFIISSSFTKELEKALKLRDFLLRCSGYQDYDLLFFKVYKKELSPMCQNTSVYVHKRLEKSFDFNIKITTKMWRAYKSDWLIRNSDVNTAALALQNSPLTILKHYSKGSEIDTYREISGFLSSYSSSLIVKKGELSTSVAAGQCMNPKPVSLSSSVIVKPDCKQPEGCLFCESFKVHADEDGLRKLLSFRYVLVLSKHLIQSDNQYKNLIGPIIKRLDYVTDQLITEAQFNDEQVKNLKAEVNEYELLTPYWARKLDLLESLGVI